MRGTSPVLFAVIAWRAKTSVRPIASRRSWAFDRVRTYPWKRRSAISAAITPLTTMPSRKTAGSRKRSDLSIGPYTVALGLDRIPCGPDLVADAPHRHDRRRLAELTAQLAHVDVHRAGVSREGVPPDTLEQLVAREHEAAMVEQFPEEVE